MACNDCSLCKAMQGRWHATPDTLYPVTIVHARYGGTYEGAKWIAFPVNTETVADTDYAGDDISCSEFYGSHYHIPIGRGQTPSAALEDMRVRFKQDEFTQWVRTVRKE